MIYSFHTPDLPQLLFTQLERVTAERLLFLDLYLSCVIHLLCDLWEIV